LRVEFGTSGSFTVPQNLQNAYAMCHRHSTCQTHSLLAQIWQGKSHFLKKDSWQMCTVGEI